MKRLFAMALACMLALTAPVCACAEDAETDWYTLEEGNTAITVRLPGNTKFGLDWKCEISAPEVMEQTGEEQLLGESEGVAGTPFTRVFRFTARAGQSGAVSLIFRYADADELETVRTFVLETVADETGAIALNSVFEQQPYADWCETDGDTVTVYLPPGANGAMRCSTHRRSRPRRSAWRRTAAWRFPSALRRARREHRAGRNLHGARKPRAAHARDYAAGGKGRSALCGARKRIENV